MGITHAFAADITKAERDEHGDLIVYGKATGPDLDLDEQVCDPAWLKQAMPEWMTWGNLREMHQPIAAGVGLELSAEADSWMVKSKVVDEGTAKKIEAGALKGYSVGIKNAQVVKDATAPGGRIVGGSIVEVSYVDRPCNPTATLAIAKAVGADTTLAPVEKADASDAGPADDEVDETGLTDEDREKAVELVTKAIGPDGQVDETTDIEGGKEAIALIARLIKAEADELAAGHLEEACDISLLVSAVECLKCWLRREQATDAGAEMDEGIAYVALAAKYGYTPAEVDALPSEMKSALAELAKRDTVPDTTKTTEAAPAASKDEIADLVKSAVTEATKAAQERVDALAAELAKVKATPIPGGPVITAAKSPQRDDRTDDLNKAAYYEHMATQVQDPSTADGYRKKAAQIRG
ncbi:MAG: hypothetical protein ACRDP6_16485 [Actinoallomurus sp.]